MPGGRLSAGALPTAAELTGAAGCGWPCITPGCACPDCGSCWVDGIELDVRCIILPAIALGSLSALQCTPLCGPEGTGNAGAACDAGCAAAAGRDRGGALAIRGRGILPAAGRTCCGLPSPLRELPGWLLGCITELHNPNPAVLSAAGSCGRTGMPSWPEGGMPAEWNTSEDW